MRARTLVIFGAAAASVAASSAAPAAVTIYGGPAYDAASQTGFQLPSLPVAPGSTAGTAAAVGSANKTVAGQYKGRRAVRFDATGNALELAGLGTDANGVALSQAYAINAAGVSVGYAERYDAGVYKGSRPVRWSAAGAATELDNLGLSASGSALAFAYAVNAAGTAVGSGFKYVGGVYGGTRAIRWDGSGTAATELDGLGTTAAGSADGTANAVNATGTAVGTATLYVAGASRGSRAVRWAAAGTTALQLGDLGTDAGGSTSSVAYAVSVDGTAAGSATKYSAAGVNLGTRAVRWDAAGVAQPLGDLGTSGSGTTTSQAVALNDTAIAVGTAEKYDGGVDRGTRAVRWDGSGAALELGLLGTDSSGNSSSAANAINAAGLTAGSATLFASGTSMGQRAVVWGMDGQAIDLNTLIDPQNGWVLLDARGISDTNWVSGIGSFDPDGAGPASAYGRAFLLQVPEPSALMLLAGVGVVMRRRRL